jgi:hypothetical protein
MNQAEVIAALEDYERDLNGILSRFTRTSSGIHIKLEDTAHYLRIVKELADLFGDELVKGQPERSNLISRANASVQTFTGTPSMHGVETVTGLVSAAFTRVRRNPASLKSSTSTLAPAAAIAPETINMLGRRIDLVVRPMRQRHGDRPTLDVADEYDLQDLFHALLKVHFDDIRAEEWTPSYAGAASRIDFLLPEAEVVIELKMTRQSLSVKQVGEQLIVDIARYRSHPQCKTLFCIVYDPSGRIANPRGVENDLNRDDGEMTVKVMIVPS